MRKIRLTVSMIVAAVAISLFGSQPALADPPTPAVFDPISFAAGEVCEFPLTLSAERNRARMITFSDGSFTIVGSFLTRVTNDATGESIVINASGPFFFKPNPDGTTVTMRGAGRFIWWFFPGDLGEGEPGALLLTTGLSVQTAPLDVSTITSFMRKGGTTENLCETLAE
jgi:hypothetical protein